VVADPGAGLGEVRSLHRYPVKSLLGESLGEVVIEPRGLCGDRRWAVRDGDGKLGSGKSNQRFRKMDGLLRFSARYAGGEVLVRLPCGRTLPVADPECAAAIGDVVGRPVTVYVEGDVPHFDSKPVHLLTTASLRWARSLAGGSTVDERRFRPNVVVEAPGEHAVEQGWVGRTIALGEVRLRVLKSTKRCVMVTLPQEELPHEPRVLSALTGDGGEAYLGVLAEVEVPGRVRAGDPVSFA
jgi:hypothetical protein